MSHTDAFSLNIYKNDALIPVRMAQSELSKYVHVVVEAEDWNKAPRPPAIFPTADSESLRVCNRVDQIGFCCRHFGADTRTIADIIVHGTVAPNFV